MAEFKDAKIGSRWEMSDGSRGLVFSRDADSLPYSIGMAVTNKNGKQYEDYFSLKGLSVNRRASVVRPFNDEFKYAEIGSQWELEGGGHAVVVDKGESDGSLFLLWTRNGCTAKAVWFSRDGSSAEYGYRIEGPWRQKLKWDGLVEFEHQKNSDVYYPTDCNKVDDRNRTFKSFDGKKFYMTLEEI